MKNFAYLSLGAILATGCNVKELDFNNIGVQNLKSYYAAPLGELTYTMPELIQDDGDSALNLQEDSTSLLFLLYKESSSYSSETDFVQINDNRNNGSISGIPSAGPSGIPLTIPVSDQFLLNYDPEDGEDLDSLFYSSGELSMTVTTNIIHNFTYALTINNITNVSTGIPVTFSGDIPGGGSDTRSQSLENHKICLEPGISNQFLVDFTGSVALPARAFLGGTESITFDMAFHNQAFRLIYGKFGRDTVQVGNEIINLSFFQDFGELGLFFKSPSLRFTFDNSYGVPLGIDFSGLYGEDIVDGVSQRINLTGPITQPPLPFVQVPDLNSPGTVKQTVIEIDETNSNLVDMLSATFHQLNLNVKAISNPTSITGTNFLQSDSRLEASIVLELPMEVRLENLIRESSFNLGTGLEFSDADSMFIRIATMNELPFSALMDMEIMDADDAVLYTITKNMVLKAPFIDINGFVTDRSNASTDIPLSKTGINAFNDGASLKFRMTLNTPPSLTSRRIFVKILTDYQLSVSIGVVGKLNVDL